MQTQSNVMTKTVKPTKDFNLGETVTWKSHANGRVTSKMGTIVAVLKPEEQYRYLRGLPLNLYVGILCEKRGLTRKVARAAVERQGYYGWAVSILEEKYKMKFGVSEGMLRNEYHYLVAVDRGDRKPYLYHPITSYLKPVD